MAGYSPRCLTKSWTWLSRQVYMCILYIEQNHFALHQKLTQHCKSTINKIKTNNKNKQTKLPLGFLRESQDWDCETQKQSELGGSLVLIRSPGPWGTLLSWGPSWWIWGQGCILFSRRCWQELVWAGAVGLRRSESSTEDQANQQLFLPHLPLSIPLPPEGLSREEGEGRPEGWDSSWLPRLQVARGPLLLLWVSQFSCSVMCNSLRPHGLQHARLPCPSPTPRACSNSCPQSWWCHPTISAALSWVPNPREFGQVINPY